MGIKGLESQDSGSLPCAGKGSDRATCVVLMSDP